MVILSIAISVYSLFATEGAAFEKSGVVIVATQLQIS